MKLSRYIHRLVWMLPAIMLAGCSDDDEAFVTADDELEGKVPSELTLTLSVPDPQVVELGSRAAGDAAIRSLTVYCFDGANAHLSHRTITSGWTDNGGGRFSVTVPLHGKTRSVHIVANATIGAADNDPATTFTSEIADAPVLWGRAALKDVLAAGSTITMIRQTAKVTVSNSAANFKPLQFGVFGTASKGSVAPAGWTLDPTTPTIAPGETYSFGSALKSMTETVQAFETPATYGSGSYARIIIRGQYQGQTGYYVVAFRTRSGSGPSEQPGNYTYTPVNVMRNHHYKVEIAEVRAFGWPTLEEAKKADPDNRITVLITDRNEAITDIIANRDYMLGVSDALSVEANATSAKITVVTSRPGTATPQIIVPTTDRSWIDTDHVSWSTPQSVSGVTAGANSTGRLYTATIPLTANSGSTQARTATLTVRDGELSRTVSLTQAGSDYKRDPNRKISVTGIPGLTCNDWFDFVDNTCTGLLPEQNRGLVRNQGLHFPAVPAYTVTYRIPALTGDKSYQTTGNFAVSKSGNTYLITATNTAATSITTGKLTIVNAAGATIEYTLYRTGYIHQLATSTNAYQREGGAVNGWFYYEVVQTQNNGSYILDRNLGASTNAPYISTHAGFAPNEGAKGAYFKISTQKSSSYNNPLTIISNLGVSQFKIPTESEVSGWGITTKNTSGTTGEAALVATVRVRNNADNNFGEVYIPHGGYFESTSAKYETHANIWTRTLLSGTQGFATNSPEFGYWYRYLDVYGSKVAFTNIRLANGSGGYAPTENSVFKYMPIRLVWNK